MSDKSIEQSPIDTISTKEAVDWDKSYNNLMETSNRLKGKRVGPQFRKQVLDKLVEQ